MDVFERLNRKFGAWYEGLFGGGGADGRELRPRDILRRILAAMEDERREGLDGKVYVPNVYTLQVAVDSDDERQYLHTFLDADELAAAVKRAAEERGYGIKGTLVFAVEEMPMTANAGRERVRIRCRFDTKANAPARPAAPPVVEMPHVAAAYAEEPDDDSDPGTLPAAPASTLASLVVRAADGHLHDVFPLTARGARIGRGRQVGNDIVLVGDGQVSKSHARIVYERGAFLLTDENSTNGTFVNGTRLRAGDPYALQSGDELRMGETVLLFRPAQVSPPRPPDGGALPVGASVPPGTHDEWVRVPVEPNPAYGVGYQLRSGSEQFRLASEMTVGRSLTGDIALAGNGVASQHARMSVRGESVYVEDLGTPGGTFVNGERIPKSFPVALYDGDQIRFGDVETRLERVASGRVAPLPWENR